MKLYFNVLSGCIAVTGILLTMASCSSDVADYMKPPEPMPILKLSSNDTLGSFIVDSSGYTLYYFANDSASVATCTSGCLKVWPPFFSPRISAALAAGGAATNVLAAGLNISDFGEITMSNGAKQTIYKGRPLYYFAPANDSIKEAPGQVLGEKRNNWYVAKPDYTIMITNARLVGGDGKTYVFNTATAPPIYTEGTGRSMYFTDGKGVTLYIFAPDSANKNKYTTTADMTTNSNWPIYEMDKIVVPTGLDKTLFGSITVFGKKQLTYKGWPLYYFKNDNMMMGVTKGITVPANKPVGSVWPVGTKNLLPAPTP